MKKAFISRLMAMTMTLALLAPCLMAMPASAAGEATQLFRWEASSGTQTNYEYESMRTLIDNVVRYPGYDTADSSKLREKTHYIHTHNVGSDPVHTADGDISMRIHYMLAACKEEDGVQYGLEKVTYDGAAGAYDYKAKEGLTLQFRDFATEFKSAQAGSMAAINLNLTYARTGSNMDPVYAVDKFDVRVKVDGAWLEETVGLRSWELLGHADKFQRGSSTTATPTNLNVHIYSLETENLLNIDGLTSGSQIQDIMIRPYGSNYWTATNSWFGVADITVNGYKTLADWESAVPDGRNDLLNIGADKMRQIVYDQGNKTLDLEWTPASDVETTSVSGTDYNNSTGKEFSMIYSKDYTYHGPTYVRSPESTYELLREKIDAGAITTDDTFGMDCNGFAYDTYSRISRSYSWRIWSTQDDNKLIMLQNDEYPIETADHPVFTDKDIIDVNNNAEDIYRGYAEAKMGDVLTHYTVTPEGGTGAIHVRLVAGAPTLAYKDDGVTIDPDNSTVPCIEQTSGVRYYIQNWLTREERVAQYNDPTKISLGTFERVLYGASGRKISFTFTDLLAADYVAYTLEEYETGKVEDIDVQTILRATDYDNLLNGFTGLVSTDYHITRYGVALKDVVTGGVLYEDQVDTRSQRLYAQTYTSDELNTTLAELEDGNYSIELFVQAGPVTDFNMDRPTHTRSIRFCVTGGKACDHGVVGDWVELTKDTTELAAGTNYYLNTDVINSRNFTVNGDVAICLYGHTLTTETITVGSGGSLNVCGCSDAQTGVLDGILAEDGGTICLYSGKFSTSNNRDELASWLAEGGKIPYVVKLNSDGTLYELVEGFVSGGEYINFGSSLNVSLALRGENDVPVDDTYTVELSEGYTYAVEPLAGVPSVSVVTIQGIAAKQMHDEITITVKKDGLEYYSDTISVYKLAEEWYNDLEASELKQTMLADMIAYGVEAQVAFKHNTGNTDTLAGGSTNTPDWGEVDSTHGVSGISQNDVAVSLSLKDKIQLNIYIHDADTGVESLVLGEGWGSRVLKAGTDYTVEAKSGITRISIYSIDVVDVKEAVNLTATLADGTVMTLKCSIADYVIQAQNGDQADLIRALQRYVDSVCAYLKLSSDRPWDPLYETGVYSIPTVAS